MSSKNYSLQNAYSLVEAHTNGHQTVCETLAESLKQINLHDASINAFIHIAEEQAFKRAQQLDQHLADGNAPGCLHGVPIAVKDLTATAGILTTQGSLRFKHHIPDTDELIISRLKAAGAVIVGKTNTPEFGFGALCKNALAGNTANPYDLSRSSGGSSGGSAAAVAAGMVPIAQGTDFGGSVRTPASFCNVVGYRPSAGLIPRVPKLLPCDTLLSHGVLARNVRDAALMVHAVSGSDIRDPMALYSMPLGCASSEIDPTTLNIAASLDLGITEIDQQVEKAFLSAVSKISNQCPKTKFSTPDFSGAKSTFETLRAAMLYRSLGELINEEGAPISETVQWNVRRGADVSAADFLAAEVKRGELIQRCLAFFNGFDVLITPAASVLPFALDQENVEHINNKPTNNIIDYLAITYVISILGFPAISIPTGFSDEGLPVGIQLIGKPGQDRHLLNIAEFFEKNLGFQYQPPSL